MNDPPIPDLDGWERAPSKGNHVTFVRDDRRAKLTVKPLSLARQDNGWIGKLWVKETPHGRSEFAGSVVDNDPAAFREKVERLAEEAE